MLFSPKRWLCAGLCGMALALPAAAADDREQGVRLGLDLGGLERAALALSALPARELGGEASAVRARLVVSWEAVEAEAGRWVWDGLDRVLGDLAARGLQPVLCLTGTHPAYYGEDTLPSPLEPAGLEPWLRFAREVVRHVGSRVSAVEIWDDPQAAGFTPQLYAFLLKATALAVRAEARALGVEIEVAQGSLDVDAVAWQRELWTLDTAPYVDALSLAVPAEISPEALRERVRGWLQEAAQHPPAPELWLRIASGGQALRVAAAALGLAAQAVFVALAAGPEDETRLGWVRSVARLVGEGFSPAPLPQARLHAPSGQELGAAPMLAALFDPGTQRHLLLLDLAAAGLEPGAEAWLELGFPGVRDARFLDPVEGTERRTRTVSEGGASRVRLWAGGEPVALVFRRQLGSAAAPGETLEVRQARLPTAEEIIARYQEVQRQQDDRLERWVAKGRVDFHFKLAQAGSTVDVAIESRYFWQRGDGLEWEQVAYFVNGNRVNWKRFPELPLIQPEKVVTLPLDLSLDRTYVYRLVGVEEVGGRPAYVIAFTPDPSHRDESLYKGRVWIDRERFVRLKASVIQTNLEAPVLSNEEVDFYRPVAGPDGHEYWMLAETRGQQIWTAGGRNFVVLREVYLTDYEINPPREDFEVRRREAYASRHLMLRDTEQGFRYLERTPDGNRVLKEEMDTNQWFAAAGLFKDSSLDSVVPLGGVNYFDYNLFERNIQFNVFFAGVFAFVNATKPDLFGGRADLAFDATGFALQRDDKVFVQGEEQLLERIEFRNQHMALRFGWPVGDFFKITLAGALELRDYGDDEEARAARDALRNDPQNPRDLTFVLPPDHTETTASLQLEFNRRGYNVTLAGSRTHRSRWAPWGLFDNTAQAFVAPEPVLDRFSRWRLSAFKEWYLPRFQKIRGEVNVLGGSDLDRFSRYQFSYFGDTRLSGFSGTGVRFDRGAIVRAGYAFNLFEAIRFDLVLEHARVKDERSGSGRQGFTGLGLSGNFVAPWKTVISFGYGRALGSDIPALEGKQEFLLTVLKLF